MLSFEARRSSCYRSSVQLCIEWIEELHIKVDSSTKKEIFPRVIILTSLRILSQKSPRLKIEKWNGIEIFMTENVIDDPSVCAIMSSGCNEL